MEGPLTIVNKKRKSRALSVPMRILRGTVKLIFSVIILIFQLAWVFLRYIITEISHIFR